MDQNIPERKKSTTVPILPKSKPDSISDHSFLFQKRAEPHLAEIRKMTEFQKELMDYVWKHFRNEDGWPSLRGLYSKYNKQEVRKALTDLGGSIGFETSGRTRWPVYRLSLLGALVTSEGPLFAKLLTRFFAYQRTIFRRFPEMDQLRAAEIASALKLKENRTQLLGQLLYLGSLGGSENPRSDWGASVMDEVADFPPDGDLSDQFEKWACRGYDPRAQVFTEDRTARISGFATSSSLPSFLDEVRTIEQKTSHRPNTAFIMMWMDKSRPELVDVSNAIKDVCKQFEIEAVRADDIEHADRITDVILERIKESEFLIADLTGQRQNVYYEIGYAHALGKRPILYCKKGTRLHFDLSIHNAPSYENITHLKELLRLRFENILGRTPKSSKT